MLLALAAALYFAQRFVSPIVQLSNAARAIAQGNFNQHIAVTQKDELGRLTQLFNHMSEQLAIAKTADERHRYEQEAVRHYLERVLESLSNGVVTLDNAGCLNTYNQSAETILGCNLAALLGQKPQDWAHQSPQHSALSQVFNTLAETEHSREAVETTYLAQDESRILLGKAVRLPEENGHGLVLVFDDITALVRAQKEAAWGEVAKRLAHEIRNPLTPIQLSAERLAWKLRGKLATDDAQILEKSTNTIVKQVAALKEMVEAFRNYARAPAAMKFKPINFNDIIAEVLVLYESSPCVFESVQKRRRSSAKRCSTARLDLHGSGRRQPALERAEQRHGLQQRNAVQRLRTLHHRQTQRHRPGAAGSEKNRGRTQRPHYDRQPCRRRCGHPSLFRTRPKPFPGKPR